jgi:hypothetical protein
VLYIDPSQLLCSTPAKSQQAPGQQCCWNLQSIYTAACAAAAPAAAVHLLPNSYGQLVLAIEVISATATLSYGILLTRYTQPKAVKGLPIADDNSPLDPDDIQFRVHVLICCYGEDDVVVGNTVEKTLLAKLPAKTKRTIYLCKHTLISSHFEFCSQFTAVGACWGSRRLCAVVVVLSADVAFACWSDAMSETVRSPQPVVGNTVDKTLLAKLPAKTKRTIYICKQALPSSGFELKFWSQFTAVVWAVVLVLVPGFACVLFCCYV